MNENENSAEKNKLLMMKFIP